MNIVTFLSVNFRCFIFELMGLPGVGSVLFLFIIIYFESSRARNNTISMHLKCIFFFWALFMHDIVSRALTLPHLIEKNNYLNSIEFSVLLLLLPAIGNGPRFNIANFISLGGQYLIAGKRPTCAGACLNHFDQVSHLRLNWNWVHHIFGVWTFTVRLCTHFFDDNGNDQ